MMIDSRSSSSSLLFSTNQRASFNTLLLPIPSIPAVDLLIPIFRSFLVMDEFAKRKEKKKEKQQEW